MKAIWALGSTRDLELAESVRSPRFLMSLRLNEIPMLLGAQGDRVEQLPGLLDMMERWIPLASRFLPESYFARTPHLFRRLCDADGRARVDALFAPYVDDTPGLEMARSQVVERIGLCEALVAAQSGLDVPPAAL